MMQSCFMIDLSNYEETFYNVFDEMIMLAWGPDVYQLIAFYFYERINDDGTENFITADDGTEVYIRNASDLYDIMQACVAGNLTADLVKFSDEAACTVVLAAPGYPGKIR